MKWCGAVLCRTTHARSYASSGRVHVMYMSLSPFLWMMMDECRAGGVSVDAARSAETCCSCILVVVRSPTQHSTLYTYLTILHFNFVVLLVYTTTPSIQSGRLAEKFLWRHRRHCPRVAIAAKATMQRPPSAPASGRTDSDTRSVHVMANLFSSLTTETDGFHCPRGHCVARLRHGHPGVGSKQPRAHEQKPFS